MKHRILIFGIIHCAVILEFSTAKASESLIVQSRAGNTLEESKKYCYDRAHCGPRSWPGLCQSGSNQSPINLPHSFIKHWLGRKVDLRQNPQYFQYLNFTLTNDGGSVQASLRDDLTSTSIIDGSLLGQSYVFSQAHFHWGDNLLHGSEHTLNFKRYPMEGHLVHYSAKYSSFTEAMQSGKKGAIAVIAVFYKETFFDNPGLAPIVNAISNVQSPKSMKNVAGLRLASLLPQSLTRTKNVIQYFGSLTTPGCSEVVFWNIIVHPERISKKQIQAFRTQLRNHEGRRLVNNYRPLQNTNGRPLRYIQSSVWS